VLQRVRAGWKVIVGETGSTSSVNDQAEDAFPYRPLAVDGEPSPCTWQCGCPESARCTGVGKSGLRTVPDLEERVTDSHHSESASIAGPSNADVRMSDAGMSTVEYAVGTVVAAAFAAVLYKIVTGDSVVDGLTNLINTALSTSF